MVLSLEDDLLHSTENGQPDDRVWVFRLLRKELASSAFACARADPLSSPSGPLFRKRWLHSFDEKATLNTLNQPKPYRACLGSKNRSENTQIFQNPLIKEYT